MIANIIVAISIALLPLYNRIGSADLGRFSKDNLFVLLAGLICLFLPERKRTLSWWTVLLPLISLTINQQDLTSSVGVLQYFYVIAGYFLFINFYEKYDSRSITIIAWGMMIGCLIQSVLIILKSPKGSLGNTNVSASYIALTGLSVFSLSRRLWWLILLPIISIYYTHSYMGTLSFLAGTVYLLNYHYNLAEKWEIYSASIIFMAIFLFLNLGVDSGRISGWALNMKLVSWKHFFFGMGVGWFHDQHIQLGNEWLMSEHNEFLAAFNIFGVLFFLLLFPTFIKYCKVKDTNPIFSSILFVAWCNSYGNFSLHTSTTALIIIIVTAICLGEMNEKNRS